MKKAIVSVAIGDKYKKQSELMLESFSKYNPDWDLIRRYDSEIKVPLSMKNNSNAFDICEAGRWITLFELANEYDEVLYCDNDIHWYGKYEANEMHDILLSPHCITSQGKWNAKQCLIYCGVANIGMIHIRKSANAQAGLAFIINELNNKLKRFIKPMDFGDPSQNGHLWTQHIASVLPNLGIDCAYNQDFSVNVAWWNIGSLDRKLVLKDDKYFVECNGQQKPLVSYHFTGGCMNLMKNSNIEAIKKIHDEYVSLIL